MQSYAVPNNDPADSTAAFNRGNESLELINPSLRATAEVVSEHQDRAMQRIQALPLDPTPYADKYFLNTLAILEAHELNPVVRAQVMIRKGPGILGGITEALAAVLKYSQFEEHGGRAYSLADGDTFEAGETVLVLEGHIQDIVALETLYLGVISAETTRNTDHINSIDLAEAKERMRAVCAHVGERPVIYFGARHWCYDEDAAIASAAFEGGARACSTDAGARLIGKRGIGTIPHVLENIIAWKVGREMAVQAATEAFDRTMEPGVPRIALIDYANREIDDSLATARTLSGRLTGVRVDTCGENVAQGALRSGDEPEAQAYRDQGLAFPRSDEPDAPYWYGHGVTVSGVYALRKALDAAGFSEVQIILSSGFGDAEKVAAFCRAEKTLGCRLFDALGVGGIYTSRAAKMDIVRVGDSFEDWIPVSKVGRSERPNERLKPVDLTKVRKLLA